MHRERLTPSFVPPPSHSFEFGKRGGRKGGLSWFACINSPRSHHGTFGAQFNAGQSGDVSRLAVNSTRRSVDRGLRWLWPAVPRKSPSPETNGMLSSPSEHRHGSREKGNLVEDLDKRRGEVPCCRIRALIVLPVSRGFHQGYPPTFTVPPSSYPRLVGPT